MITRKVMNSPMLLYRIFTLLCIIFQSCSTIDPNESDQLTSINSVLSDLKGNLPQLNLSYSKSDPLIEAYHDYYNINFSGVDHAFGTIDVGDTPIAVHIYIPSSPRGTVITAHGYTDHVGGWKHAIKWILEQEYAVLAFDFQGHGLSGGESAYIGNFDEYLAVFATVADTAEQHLPKPMHFVGHSMGAGVIVEYALTHNVEASQRIVLVSPNIRSNWWWFSKIVAAAIKPFATSIFRPFPTTSQDKGFLHFRDNLDPLQATRIPTKWFEELQDWERSLVASRSSEISPLIVQGTFDSVTEWRYNIKVLSKIFPNSTIVEIARGRHNLLNETSDIREHVLNLIGEYLAR